MQALVLNDSSSISPQEHLFSLVLRPPISLLILLNFEVVLLRINDNDIGNFGSLIPIFAERFLVVVWIDPFEFVPCLSYYAYLYSASASIF